MTNIYPVLSKLARYLRTLPATTDRDTAEAHIAGLIRPLQVASEQFWRAAAWSRDTESLTYLRRQLPDAVEVQPRRREVVPGEQLARPPGVVALLPLLSGTATEVRQRLRAMYDVREAILTAPHAADRPPLSTTGLAVDELRVVAELLWARHFYTSLCRLAAVVATTPEWVPLFFRGLVDRLFNPIHYAIESGDVASAMTYTIEAPFRDPRYEQVGHMLYCALRLLYNEERHWGGRSLLTHSHILALDDVWQLPTYDGPLADNPYVPLAVSTKLLENTQLPSEQYLLRPLRVSGHDRGLYSPSSFAARFAVFTDNMFDGLNYDNLYFSGSVVSACLVRNPLEKAYGSHLSAAKDRDMQASYPTARDGELVPAAVAPTQTWWRDREPQLRAYFDAYYPSKAVLPDELRASADNEELMRIEDDLSDIDIIVMTRDDATFDRRTYQIYQTIVANVTRRLGRTPQDAELQLIRVHTATSYKYYISGWELPRSVEIFRVYEKEAVGAITRFHFPAVRALYNGSRVWVLPSLLSYAYSGYLVDYLWLASGHSAAELLLKYYLRGAVPLLNAKEHVHISEYVTRNSDRWGMMLQQTKNTARSISPNHPLFDMAHHGHGIFHNLPTRPLPKPAYMDDELTVETSIGQEESRLRFASGHSRAFNFWQIEQLCAQLQTSRIYE